MGIMKYHNISTSLDIHFKLVETLTHSEKFLILCVYTQPWKSNYYDAAVNEWERCYKKRQIVVCNLSLIGVVLQILYSSNFAGIVTMK